MTLNEAILKVLTTPHKRDCREAYDMVTAAGYKVSVACGGFMVEEGDRYIIHDLWYGNHRLIYAKGARLVKDPSKVDFVNLLKTKTNRDYDIAREWRTKKSEAYKRYYRLKEARGCIERCEDEIAKHEERLEQAKKHKAEVEKRYAELRRVCRLK